VANPEFKRLYNSARWKRLRAAQLAASPLCAMCVKLGRVNPAGVVDHKRPHRGDEELFFDAANLQSLCKLCHDGAKQQLEKTGRLRGCGLDGLPLDGNHHWNAPALPTPAAAAGPVAPAWPA
jgi:hypothetical protein